MKTDILHKKPSNAPNKATPAEKERNEWEDCRQSEIYFYILRTEVNYPCKVFNSTCGYCCLSKSLTDRLLESPRVHIS